MIRTTGLAAAAVLLTMTAACGGGDSDGGGGGADDSAAVAAGAVPGSPVIELTVDVTGEVTAKGSTTALAATNNGIDYTSCEQYAKGEDGSNGTKYFVLPKFLQGPIDGKQVFVGAMIKGYHGPAGYTSHEMTDSGSPPGLSFDGALYTRDQEADMDVTVAADGGGTWEFTDLTVQKPDGSRSAGKVSGSVSWTCKNP